MNEGEQFEQIEPRHIGRAQPLPDQRRVEQHVRSLGQPPDRLALGHLARSRSPAATQIPAWVA